MSTAASSTAAARRPGLLTIGHGTSDRRDLVERLHQAGVQALVDVRRFPGSRHNPDVRRDALDDSLPTDGISYRWEERLGGRRRLPPDTPSFDPWWRMESFRAYAAHTRSAEFGQAMTDLLGDAAGQVTAVMCSESVWWRCHRRLIADVAQLKHGTPVSHVMPDGRIVPHQVSEGARVAPSKRLIWDLPAPVEDIAPTGEVRA